MKVGDKVIYFRGAANHSRTYTRLEAVILEIKKKQAWVLIKDSGERKRVFLESLGRV